ncbi:MAG TPA: hypothetical protein VGM39_20695 [Kofleriaceae bacterium]|jgi:hypothetical protein
MKTLAALVLVLTIAGLAHADTAIYAYPNGYKRFEFELRDGLPNGRGRAWYANGKLELVGTYVNGGRNGRFWFFTEDGAFDHQSVYFDNREVWSSSLENAEPPAQWMSHVANGPRPTREDATLVAAASIPEWARESVTPLPYFSNLDRTTSLARAGVQVGLGDENSFGFGAVKRLDAFANYRFTKFGAYGQFSETQVQVNGMTVNGRRSGEVGGTYLHGLSRVGELSTRVGFLFPMGNDTDTGFVASSAGAAQRATDAAMSVPSSSALRMGTSFVRIDERLVIQADAGVDWLFGSDQRALDAMLRANIGLGLGNRKAIVTIEIDNAMLASDLGHDLHSIALGGTVTHARFWVSTCLSLAHTGATSLNTSVGYDL